MKQEKIIAAADILATQMNHWTLFSVLATAAVISGTKPPLALWAVCGLLPVLFFLIRRYTNRFLLLAGSHLLCLALLFNIPIASLAVRLLFCLYGIGLALCSFSLRIRTKERLDEAIVPALAIGITALSLFLLHYRKHTGADFYFIGVISIYFTCYYIRCYLKNYLYFIRVNAGSTGRIPRREIFLTGTRLSLLYTLSGIAAILLLSDLNWLSWLFEAVRKGFLWLREHGFFAFLASLFDRVPEHFSEPMQRPAPDNSAVMAFSEGEPGLFWQVLERMIEILVPIFFLFLLLYALFRFVRMVWERFRHKKLFAKETASEDSHDIREHYEIKQEKGDSVRFLSFLKPKERIRRIYKQRIGARRKDLRDSRPARPFDSYTARECGNLLHAETLSLLYEKARYSNMECTRDDVRSAAGK